jgi:hypothetical protein
MPERKNKLHEGKVELKNGKIIAKKFAVRKISRAHPH